MQYCKKHNIWKRFFSAGTNSIQSRRKVINFGGTEVYTRPKYWVGSLGKANWSYYEMWKCREGGCPPTTQFPRPWYFDWLQKKIYVHLEVDKLGTIQKLSYQEFAMEGSKWILEK